VDEHKTHGRPIGYELARAKGLKVSLLEEDQKLQDLVLSVFHSSTVTLDITPVIKFIENHTGKGWFLAVEMQRSSFPSSPQTKGREPVTER